VGNEKAETRRRFGKGQIYGYALVNDPLGDPSKLSASGVPTCADAATLQLSDGTTCVTICLACSIGGSGIEGTCLGSVAYLRSLANGQEQKMQIWRPNNCPTIDPSHRWAQNPGISEVPPPKPKPITILHASYFTCLSIQTSPEA
jgi:hypothetical protein